MNEAEKELQKFLPGAKLHEDGDCQIFVAKEYGKWHLSISCDGRLPTYEELKTARYKYLPNEAMIAQLFPPKEQFINVHPYCLHLWEI